MAQFQMVPALPAATVVVLRDGSRGLEALLLRRNTQLSFHGGSWVFPGGRIDPEDYPPDRPNDVLAAAASAAVREAQEEAGVRVDPARLVLVSRWVTPEGLPKRFDTWFFVAPALTFDVCVDGGEIHAHRWLCPGEAIDLQRRNEIDLPPPTYVTLLQLRGYSSVEATMRALASCRCRTFLPRMYSGPRGPCTVYQEDIAYETGDLDRPGPRHRLILSATGWEYVKEGF